MKYFTNIIICCCILVICSCKNDIRLSGDDTVMSEVDLGLSVNWSNMNLGAETSNGFGKFYALGDVQPYDTIPYSIDLPENWADWHDSMGVVLPKYDAASFNTDNEWRIPTIDEWIELGEKCEWRWVSYKGIEGYHIEGPNGNAIFLPAAGDIDSQYGDKLSGTYRCSYVWDGGATFNVYFTKPKNANHPEITLDKNLYSKDDVYFFTYGCQVPTTIRPVRVKGM